MGLVHHGYEGLDVRIPELLFPPSLHIRTLKMDPRYVLDTSVPLLNLAMLSNPFYFSHFKFDSFSWILENK